MGSLRERLEQAARVMLAAKDKIAAMHQTDCEHRGVEYTDLQILMDIDHSVAELRRSGEEEDAAPGREEHATVIQMLCEDRRRLQDEAARYAMCVRGLAADTDQSVQLLDRFHHITAEVNELEKRLQSGDAELGRLRQEFNAKESEAALQIAGVTKERDDLMRVAREITARYDKQQRMNTVMLKELHKLQEELRGKNTLLQQAGFLPKERQTPGQYSPRADPPQRPQGGAGPRSSGSNAPQPEPTAPVQGA
eukprot:TRINITY_DN19640_c0_g1_i1.p1 TRINITY_DN19640_c0_g1~~TRINITY_DN19640_c0_g1_i1.p1  ORF type:complete len:274 (+),score=100.99 TRINITY_DN19640_c0_g1_i1:72-824(+)